MVPGVGLAFVGLVELSSYIHSYFFTLFLSFRGGKLLNLSRQGERTSTTYCIGANVKLPFF